MKNRPYAVLIPFIVAFLIVAVVLAIVYPLALLFLVIAIAIMAPIYYAVTKHSMYKAYDERAYERRQRFESKGDAAKWLRDEEEEEKGLVYQYWPASAKMLNYLARAEALLELGRADDAVAMLGRVEENRLDKPGRQRLAALRPRLEQRLANEAQVPAAAPLPGEADDADKTDTGSV